MFASVYNARVVPVEDRDVLTMQVGVIGAPKKVDSADCGCGDSCAQVIQETEIDKAESERSGLRLGYGYGFWTYVGNPNIVMATRNYGSFEAQKAQGLSCFGAALMQITYYGYQVAFQEPYSLCKLAAGYC